MINLLFPPLRGRKLTNTSCVHPPSSRDLSTREMEGQVTQTLARVSSLDPGSQRATVPHSSPRDAKCSAAAHRTLSAVSCCWECLWRAPSQHPWHTEANFKVAPAKTPSVGSSVCSVKPWQRQTLRQIDKRTRRLCRVPHYDGVGAQWRTWSLREAFALQGRQTPKEPSRPGTRGYTGGGGLR